MVSGDALATMTRTVAMRMACPEWPDCADDEGSCLACTEAAAVIAALERGEHDRALIARMLPLVDHDSRAGCPMAFHRSDGEQCTCGALEAVTQAREATRA